MTLTIQEGLPTRFPGQIAADSFAVSGSASTAQVPFRRIWSFPVVLVAQTVAPSSVGMAREIGQSNARVSSARYELGHSSVAELRDRSGLTASQIARLFGVSRRAVNHWMAGRPMTLEHEERLSVLFAIMHGLPGSDPEARRRQLLDSSAGPSLFHRLLEQAPTAETIQASPIRPIDQF
jgi:DNA-binding transcriptional regulator YiaG